jgi:hypothetical protein
MVNGWLNCFASPWTTHRLVGQSWRKAHFRHESCVNQRWP